MVRVWVRIFHERILGKGKEYDKSKRKVKISLLNAGGNKENDEVKRILKDISATIRKTVICEISIRLSG